MIITRTPFRISFLGGGTDYPEYFREHGGAVLGTAIDKYAYISVCAFHSQLFDYSIRIAYREVECVNSLDEINHSPFRECLRWCGISKDVEVNYTAELPAFCGLGSSSSFVVGLLQALQAFKGSSLRGLELAYEAIELEREVLGEAVGCQDQTFAAMGGTSLIEFRDTRDIVVHRVSLRPEREQELQKHLMLVFTGVRRRASDIARRQVERVADNRHLLKQLRQLVDDGYRELTSGSSLEKFGQLMHESWMLKSDLDSAVADEHIRCLYRTGLEAGAWGGKLLGAGGGGFLLFIVPPERRTAVSQALGSPAELQIGINAPGSHVIHS